MALAAATLIMSLGAFMPIPLIRAVMVLPLALCVPGYAFFCAAFGTKRQADTVSTLAISVVLSMALYPLVALGLNTASIRLSTLSVLAAIDILIVLCLAVSVRRPALAAWLSWPSATSLWSGLRGGVCFASIVAVVLVALVGALRVLPQAQPVPFTQFYLAGRWAHLDREVAVHPSQQLVVSVGITNHTHDTQTYSIAPVMDAGPAWRGQRVTLAAGGTWVGTLRGPAPRTAGLNRLAIIMNQGKGPARSTLTLWVHTIAT
jgi:uncharacterized membrane protein